MQPLGLLVLGAAGGFLAADVASGLVHWMCDTYFGPGTRIIGARFIAPFREHHVDPEAIARHGWSERNGNNCLAAFPLLVLAGAVLAGAAHPWWPAVTGFVAALGLTLCITNQIHAWAHASHVPRAVRWLQRHGVLLAPERHARHHTGVARGSYAIVSGWSNQWLDTVLPRTEAMLARLGVRSNEEGSRR